MTRVIHAPYDPVTPFDLSAHIFVDVEFFTYYREKFSSQKATFGHLFEIFFQVGWPRWISNSPI